ncbi:hypothetical protein M2T79_02530 [Elizabethkingia miricola]|uniref:hypothetical protein n=1 Tax=Elizabethkingia miricola TaxID=172045 RepID=UPI00201946D8|nr:hypothetical protein [Elizabethkingia miricola]MCL1655457.1 hypothetical protein [Elizabethkingia miricola]
MDKLELKDIAPYLPYKPIVIVNDTERNLTAVSIDSEFVFVTQWKGSREKQMIKIENIKPILRPMSDLTKEITHNGETFVPLHRILEAYCFDLAKMDKKEIQSYAESLIEIDISYRVLKMLAEWHIDFQDLIGRDLAINLNEVDNGK